MTDTTMTWDGKDNTAAVMSKMIDNQKQMVKAIEAASKAATKGAELAAKGYSKQSEVINNLKKKVEELKSAQSGTKSSVSEIVTGWNSALGIVMKVAGTVKSLLMMQREQNAELAKTSLVYDDIIRKMRLQSGMGNQEQEMALKTRLFNISQDTAVPLQQAAEVSTEMMSLGFSQEEAQGKSLHQVLQGATAQNETSDLVGYAKALSTYLTGNQLDKSGENINLITGAISSLKETQLKGSDLKALAPVGEVLRQSGMSVQSQLAHFTVAKDRGFEPGQVATGMRNMADILGTLNTSKTSADRIRLIGGDELLKDLRGKNTDEQLPILKAALDKMTLASQKEAKADIFGRENVAIGTTLLDNLDEVQKHIKKIDEDNGKTLKEQVAVKASGDYARGIRVQNQKEVSSIHEGQKQAKNQQIIDIVDTILMEQGRLAPERKLMTEVLKLKSDAGDDLEEILKKPDAKLGEVSSKALDRFQKMEAPGTNAAVKKYSEVDPSLKGKKASDVKAPVFGDVEPNFERGFRDQAELTAEQLRLQVQAEQANLDDLNRQTQEDQLERDATGKRRTHAQRRKIKKELAPKKLEIEQRLHPLQQSLEAAELEADVIQKNREGLDLSVLLPGIQNRRSKLNTDFSSEKSEGGKGISQREQQTLDTLQRIEALISSQKGLQEKGNEALDNIDKTGEKKRINRNVGT